jgi:hypothetical protein
MIIRCIHGYFICYEQRTTEIAKFNTLFGSDLVPCQDYYTFQLLYEAKSYSLAGLPYLGTNATVNYEGSPWDVMAANGLIYNFESGHLVPILSITTKVDPKQARGYQFTTGLILPGSVDSQLNRISGYQAQFDFEFSRFDYTSIDYV